MLIKICMLGIAEIYNTENDVGKITSVEMRAGMCILWPSTACNVTTP